MITEKTFEKDRSALLADLNRGGVSLVEKWVNRLIDDAREKHATRGSKIRIVDIGCGVSPYLQDIKGEDKGEDLDLHFWDMEEQATLTKGLDYNPHKYGTFEKVKFPRDVPKAVDILKKQYNNYLNAGEPLFHIILCSAGCTPDITF